MSEIELLDTTPKCWICSVNDADSGEHIIKKSDGKILFSEQLPIHHEINGVRKEPISDLNDRCFKYHKSICTICNNERTQKSDKAWEQLSKYLHDNWKYIKLNQSINLPKLFTNNVDKKMILVQLYFVKIFGCAIKESKVQINLDSFSEAILNQKEHPLVYISFRDSADCRSDSYATISDIEMFKNNNGVIEYAHMFYRVGNVVVDIIYSENTDNIDLNGALKPSEMKSSINLSKLNYNQDYNPFKLSPIYVSINYLLS